MQSLVGDESSASKNRKKGGKGEGGKDGKKKHRKVVNIKDDYIRSLQDAIEILKALNDEERKEKDAEIQALKENRDACANQAQAAAKAGMDIYKHS